MFGRLAHAPCFPWNILPRGRPSVAAALPGDKFDARLQEMTLDEYEKLLAEKNPKTNKAAPAKVRSQCNNVLIICSDAAA